MRTSTGATRPLRAAAALFAVTLGLTVGASRPASAQTETCGKDEICFCGPDMGTLRTQIAAYVAALVTAGEIPKELKTPEGAACQESEWTRWAERAATVDLDLRRDSTLQLSYDAVRKARTDPSVAHALCRSFDCQSPGVLCFSQDGDFLLPADSDEHEGCTDGTPWPAEPGQTLTVYVLTSPEAKAPIVELRASADRWSWIRPQRAEPAPPPAGDGARAPLAEAALVTAAQARRQLVSLFAGTQKIPREVSKISWLARLRDPVASEEGTTQIWRGELDVPADAPENLAFVEVNGRLWRLWLRPSKHVIDFAVLFPFVFNQQHPGTRTVPGTGERVYTRGEHTLSPGTPKLGVTVYPAGRCDDVVTPFLPGCYGGMFGLQAAFTPDFEHWKDEFYAGALFEPVTGVALSGGLAIIHGEVLPAGVSGGDLVPTIDPPSMGKELRVYGYVGLTISAELFDIFKKRDAQVMAKGSASAPAQVPEGGGESAATDRDEPPTEAPAVAPPQAPAGALEGKDAAGKPAAEGGTGKPAAEGGGGKPDDGKGGAGKPDDGKGGAGKPDDGKDGAGKPAEEGGTSPPTEAPAEPPADPGSQPPGGAK